MKNVIFVTALLFCLTLISNAQSLEQKGMEVAIAADNADRGFNSSAVSIQMTLKNKNGQTSERKLIHKVLELVEDGDKSLVIFVSPKDVKGTAALTFTHKIGSDDQWLYLPAVARVKRISSNNKSGPFVGSEFAYEDLSSQEVEKYSYKYIEEKDGIITVELDPVDPKSGYSKRIVHYNKNKGYRIEKIEFYDRKESLLKTLTYTNYKLYKNKFWRALEQRMINHQTGKETAVLVLEEYDFDVGLTDDDFNQNALKRAGN